MYNQENLLSTARELREKQKNPFSRQNKIILLACKHPDMRPRDIAAEYNRQFVKPGTKELDGKEVLTILHKADLKNVEVQARVCAAAWEIGGKIALALKKGQKPDWKQAAERLSSFPQKERIILMSAIDRLNGLWSNALISAVLDLGKFSCRDFFQLLIEEADGDGAEAQTEVGRLQERIKQLHHEVHRLKDSIREQVEDAAAEERENFFAQLNDEESGQILDLMVLVKRGFDRMRIKGEPIPADIKNARTLVRCMQKFLSDYGVEQMMSLGETMEITCWNVDELIYEGTPFSSDDDKKMVEVISTGWEIPDRDIVISYPRVREISEEQDCGN